MKFFLITVLSLINFYAFASDDFDPKALVKFGMQTIEIDGENYLSVNYHNEKKWHTYWVNPGDAGKEMKNKFSLDGSELTLSELEWPVPKKYIEEGDILAYGYEGSYSLFFHLPKKHTGEFKLSGHWLVCKHICIPGSGEITGVLNSGDLKVDGDNLTLNQSDLEKSYRQLPGHGKKPKELELYITKGLSGEGLTLHYSLKGPFSKGLTLKPGLLTPFPNGIISFKREYLYSDDDGNLVGTMDILWEGDYLESPVLMPTDGDLKTPLDLSFLYRDPSSLKITKIGHLIKSFSVSSTEGLKSYYKSLTPYGSQNVKTKSAKNETSFFTYLLFAFLGGLILNIMPCVLPIISLKLFGLLAHSAESKTRILRHNLTYSAGVISTFLLLAGLVLILQRLGEQVGWGFQMQSISFVGAMIMVLFLMALNLFGLFEFGTPGGKTLGGAKLKGGFKGDFLTGVLSTILSTPCSAPFLGTALTFAFTSPPHIIFLMFFFIGLGLSFPFLATGFFPGCLKLLPKPGLWMENLKKFLGLTILLTLIWLFDVFISLSPTSMAMNHLTGALIFIFFAIFFHQKMSKSKMWKSIYYFLSIAMIVGFIYHSQDQAPAPSINQATMTPGELPWMPWSREKMKSLKGELVFINFTAKWCFTCKVNEKFVLHSDDFKNLIDKYQLKLLLGDWTKRDDRIGSFLKENSLVGVPAYFIQKKNGELISLGETISISKIESNLK
ncbi:MAG: hypothetical protein HOE90_22120 [Bacteriovoracaceae bacterium]|jgi:thiol:disulfide interchange protein|nr:hypothetical protein [Bacteriovoracaceae bacterium]